MITTTSGRDVVIRWVATAVGVLIIAFIILRLWPFLRGPIITSSNLRPVTEIEAYHVDLELTLQHTNHVWINGISTLINEKGEVTHPLPLSPGRNTIEVVLQDSFKHERTYIYTIITPALEEIYIPVYNEAIASSQKEDDEATVSTPDQE